MTNGPVLGRGLTVAIFATAFTGSAFAQGVQPTVIELTQVGCQFLESERGVDHGFDPRSAADCEAINARTAADRLAKARVLELAPGRYVFRVKNLDVPYDLGFWLRGDGLLNRARLPSVSGGGLATGATGDYEIELAPGSTSTPARSTRLRTTSSSSAAEHHERVVRRNDRRCRCGTRSENMPRILYSLTPP